MIGERQVESRSLQSARSWDLVQHGPGQIQGHGIAAQIPQDLSQTPCSARCIQDRAWGEEGSPQESSQKPAVPLARTGTAPTALGIVLSRFRAGPSTANGHALVMCIGSGHLLGLDNLELDFGSKSCIVVSERHGARHS